MKKSCRLLIVFSVLILSLIVCNSFIISAVDEAPNPVAAAGISDSDVQRVQGAVNSLPISDNGSFDPSKFKPLQSKADQRIAAINDFIKTHAPWLKFLFGMTPEFSWLFLVDFLVILSLIANFRNIFFFYSAFSGNVATLIGVLMGLLATQVGVSVKIATFLVGLFSQWWFKLILVVAFFVIIAITLSLGKWAKARRLERAKMMLQLDAEHSKRWMALIGKLEKDMGEAAS